MFLTVMIYAVGGISLFASVKHVAPMNKRLNFGSFVNAFMTLIRICTGEGWNDLMYALSSENTEYNSCSDDSYGAYAANDFEEISCGANQYLTWLYFISYTFMLTLVFLNLFIAIILQGYFDASNHEG